ATSNVFLATLFPASTPTNHAVAWFQGNGGGDAGLSEPYVSANIGVGTVGFPGNLWQIVVDTPGTLYNQATTSVAVGSGTATLAPVVTAGAVTAIVPTTPHELGDSYGSAPSITITDTGTG